jgi:hypothetical protein
MRNENVSFVTCSNYVYLGLIAERLTGLDLDAAAKKLLCGRAA